MKVFYNDFEPFCVEWMNLLSMVGYISPGDVSGASIKDLEAWQIVNYDRAHFFAGIGGWDYALQLAGWPEHIPVWTGSCPCQPFSAAGKRKGVDDDRHLWPDFRSLIEQCQPPIVFGEQVASADGREWLVGVRSDLEALGYVVGAADLCAAGVGAPHIRQRLYWLAYSKRYTGGARRSAAESGESVRAQSSGPSVEPGRRSDLSGLGNADDEGSQGFKLGGDGSGQRASRPAGLGCFWSAFDIAYCRDGKARRIEPGTFPLANGVPARVGKLRAYGNAIVPQVAATFIAASMEALGIEPIY